MGGTIIRNTEKDSIDISKHKVEIIFGKYLIAISIFFSLIVVLLAMLAMGGVSSIYYQGMSVIIICCGFLIVLAAIAKKHIKGFAYSMNISFLKQRIIFRMFTDDLIEAKFEQINNIRVNGYIFFELGDKTIMYNDLTNRLLFETINEIKKIEWGKKCWIWGPPKEFRKKLENDSY